MSTAILLFYYYYVPSNLVLLPYTQMCMHMYSLILNNKSLNWESMAVLLLLLLHFFVYTLKTLSAAGTVQSVLDSGDIRVRYPSGRMWTMNPDVVVRVSQ